MTEIEAMTGIEVMTEIEEIEEIEGTEEIEEIEVTTGTEAMTQEKAMEVAAHHPRWCISCSRVFQWMPQSQLCETSSRQRA